MTTPQRTVVLTDFLTPSEIADLVHLWENHRHDFHAKATLYLRAILPTIDRKIGHANDPSYLAYAVEHVFTQATRE